MWREDAQSRQGREGKFQWKTKTTLRGSDSAVALLPGAPRLVHRLRGGKFCPAFAVLVEFPFSLRMTGG
jgi:hypothetical protein